VYVFKGYTRYVFSKNYSKYNKIFHIKEKENENETYLQ